MMKLRGSLLATVAILASALVIYSCSGTGASVNQSYQGPGSDYDVTLNADGTFQIIENDANWDIQGTYISQLGPFKKLTVTSSNTGSVNVGDVAYGLDIPGIAFFLKPLDTANKIIAMVKSGQCPSANLEANWIITKYNGGSPSTSDLFGTFQYNHATESALLPIKYKLDGSVFGSNDNIGSFSCDNGQGLVGGATMYFSGGGALVNANGQYIIAFEKSQILSTSNLADTYYGLLYQQSAGTVTPVKGVINQAGTLSLTDVDTNTGTTSGTVSASITINGVDSPADGFIDMSIGSDKIRCMGNANMVGTGKKLIFCAAKDPSGSAGQLYNLLLITE